MAQIRTLKTKLAHSSIYAVGDYFEVQFNLDRKGVTIDPKDEDFGVWAWTAYTLEKAERIANEIETGARKISPMLEVAN